MIISVFGGSSPKEGDTAYLEAYKLGKGLAERGHIVLNGGYIGTMDAVSRGAAEAGGKVIGATCQTIESWRPVKPNPWIHEERRYKTLQERLSSLTIACDAAIALPGGPGTLTEIALTWNMIIIEEIPRKPLLLIGDGWNDVISKFFEQFNGYIPEYQRSVITFVKDVDSALSQLSKTEKDPQNSF